MFNHAYERIATLRDPFIDSHGAGYQMTHARFMHYTMVAYGERIRKQYHKKDIFQRQKQILFFSDHYRRAWANCALCVSFLIILIMHENLLFKQSL